MRWPHIVVRTQKLRL